MTAQTKRLRSAGGDALNKKKTVAAAARPPSLRARNLLSQLEPIPGIDFSWREFQALARSREAELAPSYPAFLVDTDVHQLASASTSTSGTTSAAANGAPAPPAFRRTSRGVELLPPAAVRRGISPAEISTQTKIVILSDAVDVDALFWLLPVIRYEEPRAGILKKQILVHSASPEEVDAYLRRRAGLDRFFTETVTAAAQNDNVHARKTGFADSRIPFVGVVSKDLVSSQSMAKLTFIHCTTLNLRAWNAAAGRWCEVHLKVFSTGKIIIPGIVSGALDMFLHVLALVLQLLNDAQRVARPDAPPLFIRHDLTSAFGVHFADPHGLLPPGADRPLVGEWIEAPPLDAAAPAGPWSAAVAGGGGSGGSGGGGAAEWQQRCPMGCVGLMMVDEASLPTCASCGTVVPFALDHGPEWRAAGDGGAHDARAREVPRCGAAVNPSMIETSFACRLAPVPGNGGGMRNAAKWMSWMGGGQTERALGDEIALLRRVGGVAELPRAVVATAELLMHRLRGHACNRGLTKPMRRMRYLWLACQAHGCPRTVPEMAALFRASARSAAQSCALNFEDVVAESAALLPGAHRLYFGPILPGHFVHRFAARMGVASRATSVAMYVATLVARHDVMPGSRPHAVAASALYYAAMCCGAALTKKSAWLLLDREVSEVGIHRCFTKLCFYRVFPAELRTEFPGATDVEDKCLGAQNLLAASASALAEAARVELDARRARLPQFLGEMEIEEEE
jgi:transcription initiation factor TFIIIB Brf1 subunit/transcription initiation factor TFIIB